MNKLILWILFLGLSSCCNNDNEKPSCPDLMEWKDGDCRCPDTHIQVGNNCMERGVNRYFLDTSYCNCINEFVIEFIGEPKKDIFGNFMVQEYGINTLEGGDQGGEANIYPNAEGDSLTIENLYGLEQLDFCISGGPWYAIYMKRNKTTGIMNCKVISSEDIYHRVRQDSCTYIMKN